MALGIAFDYLHVAWDMMSYKALIACCTLLQMQVTNEKRHLSF